MKLLFSALVLVSLSGNALAIEADARRGAALFSTHKCTNCHSISGSAEATPGATGATAPDLGKRRDREYTPASMTSRMWNHAPNMWSAMRSAGMEAPKLSESDSADLFAFFYSKRFFEKRGDAARGKQVFEKKNCADCHMPEKLAPGKWASLTDPIDFIQRMWNHAPEMRKTNVNANNRWPLLSPEEMTDLLVYVQNLPDAKNRPLTLQLPAGTRGKELMDAKGCRKCHEGVLALETRLSNKTLTEIAASMWNHAPMMREAAQTLSPDEMREIIAYTWASGFFAVKGDQGKGARLFDSRCGACHNDRSSGAPDLKAAKRAFNTISLTSALWQHGPTMLAKIEKDGKRWPSLTPGEVSNLISYLNTGGSPR